jgi:hypothetical protein
VPLNVSPLNVAAPFPAVVAVAPLAVAPAGLGVAVTTMPAWLTGLPLASWSWTTGCCASGTPLRAVLEGGVVTTTFVAAPAVPVAVKVRGLPASVPDVAVSVFVPAVGPRVHDVAAATPSAPVVTGDVGVTVPLPGGTANVTATPATGLPLASLAITAGGDRTALPAGASWVTGLFAAIDVAAPALSAIAPEVAGVIPAPPPKLRV